MPPITRGAFSALLSPDLRRVFVDTGKERPLEYEAFLNVEDMPWNPVTDRQISGLGQMPTKPEGTQFAFDEPILGGTKAHTATPYGLAVEITFEMWRDELYGVMRELIAEMARAARNRQEVSAWSILNNAFSTSFVGFTSGEALCATSHTRLDGGTTANRPSPDISFSTTGLQAALTRFENMVDERGLPRLMQPSLAIVAPENKFTAREVLGSVGKPGTADNEINALVDEDLSWMICHYLTTTTYHFLAAAKGVHDLQFLWADRPIFDSFDDPRTKNAVFTAYQRFTQGWGSYRGLDGSTG